jgi:hypothetical protein
MAIFTFRKQHCDFVAFLVKDGNPCFPECGSFSRFEALNAQICCDFWQTSFTFTDSSFSTYAE